MRILLNCSHRLLQVTIWLLAFGVFGCQSNEDVQPNVLSAELESEKKFRTTIHYGPETMIGDGTARVWVEMVQGKPVELGIELSADAISNIQEYGMTEMYLKMPGQAHATGYKTIAVSWNPMGHDPMGVYSLPHFDFHFYMLTEGQIRKIAGGPDFGALSLIERGVLPEFYSFGPVPFAVPHMGVHWSDVRSPEFSPAGFSRTFIYGSYQDKITFLEPMVTLAYLQSLAAGEKEEMSVPSLLIHETPGYYPESYTISHNLDGTYSIALTDLEWHNRHR